jgi:energy-coupling factor transport system permease protein
VRNSTQVEAKGAVDPPTALSALIAVIAASCFFQSPIDLGIYALGMIAILSWRTRMSAANFAIVGWVLPFCLPLLFIHGILNSGFAVSFRIWGVIPWRPAGFDYGIVLSLRVLLIGVAAAFWAQTRRDEVVEYLIRLRLPLWIVLLLAQSVAVGALIERRVLRVYQAQQARGIRVGPDLLSRIRAFPAILIPAVVTTLLEADARAPALTSRGFGASQILPEAGPPISVSLGLEAVYPLALLALEVGLRHLQ